MTDILTKLYCLSGNKKHWPIIIEGIDEIVRLRREVAEHMRNQVEKKLTFNPDERLIARLREELGLGPSPSRLKDVMELGK